MVSRADIGDAARGHRRRRIRAGRVCGATAAIGIGVDGGLARSQARREHHRQGYDCGAAHPHECTASATMCGMNHDVAACLLVSKVLVADGMMTDDEHAFLADLMTRFGLGDEDRKRIIELEGWDEAEPFLRALPVEQRQAIVELLVDAASADGKLSAHEHATIKQVAAALAL